MKVAAILSVAAALAWWLSGYDSNLTGEHAAADLARRTIRTGVTVLLLALGVAELKYGGVAFIALVLPLAIIWAGCLSEFFAQATHGLIDSPDPTDADPGKLARELDRLAELTHQGRHQEALHLCTTLLGSRDASVLGIEAMLFRLYDQMLSDQCLSVSPVAAETERLCQERRYPEAELQLNQTLTREPANVVAAFTLLRLYAQDLQHPEKAHALLHRFHEQNRMPPGFLDYARHRLEQWTAPSRPAEGIESLLVRNTQPNRPTDS